MNVLLDTQLLIWLAEESPRLPSDIEATILDIGRPMFSVVSLWEVAIKTPVGQVGFQRRSEGVAPVAPGERL